MNLKKIILDFYKSDALINPTVLAEYLHDDIILLADKIEHVHIKDKNTENENVVLYDKKSLSFS